MKTSISAILYVDALITAFINFINTSFAPKKTLFVITGIEPVPDWPVSLKTQLNY
jgi:hypothetical protein